MTAIEARRRLHKLMGREGNWRFKGLLLADCPDSGVTRRDVAAAWPTKPSDYRALARHPTRDPETEHQRMLIAEEGTEEGRFLSDYAEDALRDPDLPDHVLAEQGDVDPTGGVQVARTDEAIQHALFAQATVEELDTLWRKQLSETIGMGARRKRVARDASFVFESDTKSGDVPIPDDEQYPSGSQATSGGIAEGGIIPDDREGYSTVSWSCIKLAQGAQITDEMIDHAMIDIIERQIRHVGTTVENGINRVWLNNLVDNANQSHTAAGSGSRGVPAINSAIEQVEEQDFEVDTLVTNQSYRQELFDDTNLVYVNRAGGDDSVLRDRQVDGALMGVQHHPMTKAAYNSSSNTFDFDSASDIGAVVYGSDHHWLVLYKDIEVKDYEDPIRDLQGVNARAWVDATYAQTDAAATVKHD